MLIFVPYMIMIAVALFYGIILGPLGFIFLVAVIAEEIPFMFLYTIILGLSLIIRWIVIRRRKRE